MCNNKLFLLFICLVFSVILNGQSTNFINKYKLKFENDSIEYVILGDTTRGKLPTLVYCTGSLAHPLFIDKGTTVVSTLPFDNQRTTENCYVVVLSKKGVPIVAAQHQLNKKFIFIDSTTQNLPKEYSDHNTLDFYAKATNLVINQVVKYNFINNDSMLIVGHSAGSRLATKVAVQNKNITQLGYLSSEPLGRYYEILKKNQTKKDIERSLNKWKNICQFRHDLSTKTGDSNQTWFSNSENVIDDLLLLNIPIYAAYGTKDYKSVGMILIPYEFHKNNKSNLTFRPYDNMDHSFFTVGTDGKVNYDQYHFDEVMQDILNWWLE